MNEPFSYYDLLKIDTLEEIKYWVSMNKLFFTIMQASDAYIDQIQTPIYMLSTFGSRRKTNQTLMRYLKIRKDQLSEKQDKSWWQNIFHPKKKQIKAGCADSVLLQYYQMWEQQKYQFESAANIFFSIIDRKWELFQKMSNKKVKRKLLEIFCKKQLPHWFDKIMPKQKDFYEQRVKVWQERQFMDNQIRQWLMLVKQEKQMNNKQKKQKTERKKRDREYYLNYMLRNSKEQEQDQLFKKTITKQLIQQQDKQQFLKNETMEQERQNQKKYLYDYFMYLRAIRNKCQKQIRQIKLKDWEDLLEKIIKQLSPEYRHEQLQLYLDCSSRQIELKPLNFKKQV